MLLEVGPGGEVRAAAARGGHGPGPGAGAAARGGHVPAALPGPAGGGVRGGRVPLNTFLRSSHISAHHSRSVPLNTLLI